MTFDDLLKNPPSCTKILPETDIFEIKDNFKEWSHVPSQLIFDNIPDLKPTVSIMIPTYRRPVLLEEAIESALNQNTEITFEVVVVDNESSAHEIAAQVETAVRKFADKNIRYFRNSQNIGMFGNWNRCIEIARGKYISILNDDDLLNEDFIEKSLKLLTKEPSATAVAAAFSKLHNARLIEVFQHNDWLKQIDRKLFWQSGARKLDFDAMIVGNRIPGTLGVLALKSAYVSLGGFNAAMYPASDYVFWLLFIRNFELLLLKENLSIYRWEVNESQRAEVSDSFHYCNFLIRRHLLVSPWMPRIVSDFININISRTCQTLQRCEQGKNLGKFTKYFYSLRLRILIAVAYLFYYPFRINITKIPNTEQ